MTPLAIAHAPASAGATPTAAPVRGFGAALAAAAPSGSAHLPRPPGPAPSLPDAARAALEGVDRARRRLDGVLQAARRGRTFTAQELLALQADAYRYSQTLDVASRVVEHGAQAVKQAIQTQV